MIQVEMIPAVLTQSQSHFSFFNSLWKVFTTESLWGWHCPFLRTHDLVSQ